MSIKILGILGSPRRGGNTEILLDKALAGAQSRGAEIEKLVTNELKITPCQGCSSCATTGECVIKDDMQTIYPKLEAADCLFLASPIFFLSVSAQVKSLIDRCQCLWTRKYVLNLPIAAKGIPRKGLFISAAHSNLPTAFQPAISVVKAFFATLDVNYEAELLFQGIGRKEEILEHPTACHQSFAVGAELAGGESRIQTQEVTALPSLTVEPIGKVINRVKEPVKHGWETIVSEIVIKSSLTQALEELEEFSHITVLFWMHKTHPQPSYTKVHPRGRQDLPLVGIFATRTPHRPNPVGIATVRLLERRGNILKVKGLDAIDGTPVIDIKPYFPSYDSPFDATVPDWVTKL